MYFDIFKSSRATRQKYYWVAKGGNNEPMATSEMLSSKQSCVNAIRTIKQEAARGRVFDETGEVTGSVDDHEIRVR